MAFETPFLPQNFFQQPRVGMRWHSVNLVIRSHHAHDAGFFHCRSEAGQEEFAEHSLGIVCGSDVRAAFRLAVGGKVLRGGNDMIAINGWSVSLQRLDDCYSHARDEIRVFSISFLCAPQRGSRATSRFGPSTCWLPRALVSSAAAVKTFSMNSGSQVLASAIGCGKLVLPLAMC